MADIIVGFVVVVLLGLALRGTIRHFKGESSCCGGGSCGTGKAGGKKLSQPVLGKKTVRIQGMHCDHCVRSVTRAINGIEGASVKVNLKDGKAVVSYDRALDDDILRQAVEGAGFRVLSIES